MDVFQDADCKLTQGSDQFSQRLLIKKYGGGEKRVKGILQNLQI